VASSCASDDIETVKVHTFSEDFCCDENPVIVHTPAHRSLRWLPLELTLAIRR
jgi:hypothetical protein